MEKYGYANGGKDKVATTNLVTYNSQYTGGQIKVILFVGRMLSICLIL
jgi:hypothetical protein